jgi:hypothetical protein
MTNIIRDYLLTVSFVLLIAGIATVNGYSQDLKPSRQAAEAAWNAGDFEKAYQNYNGLLLMYSRDPQYAYYAGACLVELNRDSNRAVTLLNSALHSSQSVKNIPDEIWLYYGRALKQDGNCAEAVKAIEKYKKLAGKKKSLEMNAQRYIDECAGNYTVDNLKADDKKADVKTEDNKNRKKKGNQADNSKDFKRLKASADIFQSKSDSLLRIAEEIRSKIDSSPDEVKGLMKSRVIELEEQAGYYLSSADSIRQAIGIEIPAHNFIAQKPLPGAGQTDSNFVSDETIRPEQTTAIKSEPVVAPVKEPVEITKEYDNQLTKAMRLQYLADSLNRSANSLRRQSVAETEDNKRLFSTRATEMEALAVKYQSEADKILLALQPDAQKSVENKAEAVNEPVAPVKITDNTVPEKVNDAQPNETKVIQPVTEVTTMPTDKKAVYTCFEIKSKPAYSDDNPVPVGRKINEGLIYHIQLAALRNQVSPSYFRNLYPVFGLFNATKGVTYYYAGMFRTHDAAAQNLPSVRKTGFSDAFIVAFIDDAQVSMEKAAAAEKQWAGKPLYYEDAPAVKPETATEINAGTLTFRAEVMRYTKPVKPEVLEKAELLAGTKKLDIIKSGKGESILLIGNFITFESANEYVSLLKRNGYAAARVVAYVGNSEMPLEKAKELLNTTLNE